MASGYYADADSSCYPCHSKCKIRSGKTDFECTFCYDTNTTLLKWLILCYRKPLGNYENDNTVTLQWSDCTPIRETCESETHCNTCIDNWYLYATTCDDNRTTNQIMVAQMDTMMEMLLNVLLVKHHVLNMMD